jgi:putative sterol carrier protein
VSQGLGLALWEEMIYDDQGRLLNGNLLDYRLPTTRDLPAIETIIVEVPSEEGPYGARIIGEPSIVAGLAAVDNAIANATGEWVSESPFTPERVLRSLGKLKTISISAEEHIEMDTLLKPTKEQIQQFYSRALQRSLDAYAKLDDKEWEKKASEQGTAKHHLAQLVGTIESETLPITRQALAGEKINIPGFQTREELVSFRESTAKAVADLSTGELLERMKKGYGDHIAILDTLSESDLDKPTQTPAWDRPGTVRDLFFASYLLLPGQYQEIRRVNKKKLPHWIEDGTPDQVNYHMGRLFNYMPLIFRSDKAGDLKATYLFTMEGDGGGQWNLRIGDGRADSSDGSVDSPDIEIKTKPESWIDLSTGDLNPMMAVMPPFGKVKLSGSLPLALKLGELFSADE